MISVEDLFGSRINHPEATEEKKAAAHELLLKVNDLLAWARFGGFLGPIDHDTGTQVSGAKNGSGDGGFRLSGSSTGRPASKHKLARAVDVYDPGDVLDHLLTDEDLERFGLWREAPSSTPTWVHLQDLPPASGRRTFKP